MHLRSWTQNQQVSEHRKKYSKKMPGAVSKNRKHTVTAVLFYRCESKKWEPVYWLTLTGRTPPGYVGRRSDEEFLPEKRRDPGMRVGEGV